MPYYSYAFVIAVLCATLYYRAGAQEIGSGLPWAGLSAAVSGVMIGVLQAGAVATLVAQGGLLLAIAAFRVWRDPQ